MYERRDNEFKGWLDNSSQEKWDLELTRELVEDAFNAGWKARKQLDYETLLKITPHSKDDLDTEIGS